MAVVAILGMHRSGTSCLTGLLQEVGVFLGTVATKSDWNLKGNRENPGIMALHEELLGLNGGSWDAPPISVTWPHRSRLARDAIIQSYENVPLWGFKTLLALGISRLVRANLLATAIAATLHDVALPLMPLLLRWEYDIGYWLLSHPHELPPSLRLSHHSPSVWFHWSTFLTLGRPLLLGALIIAAPVATATYYITLAWVQRSQPKTAAPTEEKH